MTIPLSDMRGCKSLHAYAVRLERENAILKENISHLIDLSETNSKIFENLSENNEHQVLAVTERLECLDALLVTRALLDKIRGET